MPPAAQTVAARPADESSSNIEEEARRLQSRIGQPLGADTVPAARNPVRFGEPRASSAAAVRRADAAASDAEAPPPAPTPFVAPEPSLRLIGMATDESTGTVVRTAVLRTARGGCLRAVNDTVAGYRVSRIDSGGRRAERG
jgi:hypothetical protein